MPHSTQLRTHTHSRFVEYETAADLTAAVEKLDTHDFKGVPVHCISDVHPLRPKRLWR